MKNGLLLFLFTILVVSITACGTVATPIPNSMTLEAQAAGVEDATQPPAVVVAPTDTPILTEPPTLTPEPPTATPTDEPEVEIEETVAPTATQDPVVLLVSRFGDPARGQTLFSQALDTNMGMFACSTCHQTQTDDQTVGPGLFSLAERAGDRVEGMPAEVYVYLSIIQPEHYTVEGFPPGLMPQNYGELFSDQDVYDLAAYVLSLGD
jgi:cytochrome c553